MGLPVPLKEGRTEVVTLVLWRRDCVAAFEPLALLVTEPEALIDRVMEPLDVREGLADALQLADAKLTVCVECRKPLGDSRWYLPTVLKGQYGPICTACYEKSRPDVNSEFC